MAKLGPNKYTKKNEKENRTCICGCNTAFECESKSSKKYITGHNNRGRKLSLETKIKMSEAQKRIGNKPPLRLGKKNTLEHNKKIGLGNKGKVRSLEQIEVNRRAHLGKKQSQETIERRRISLIGQKRTLEQRKNISESLIGKKQTLQARQNNSKAHLGKSWGKHTDEWKNKQSEFMKNRVVLDSTREKFSRISSERIKKFGNHFKGCKHKDESKKKMRLSRIKNIEANYGIANPSYNREACEFFKKFDEYHNTKGRYAVYGDGEFYIKELGYFPDYINFDLKLIIEWDEGHHFNEDGSLREKDIKRQEEIKLNFPDFKFLRINTLNKSVIKV